MFISPNDEAKLDETAIPYYHFQLGDDNGIILEEGELLRALGALEARITDRSETQYEGLTKIWWERNDGRMRLPETPPGEEISPIKVEVDAPRGMRCDHWINFKDNLKDWLIKNIDVPAIIHIQSEAKIDPDGKLHLIFLAGHEGEADQEDSGVYFVPGEGKIFFDPMRECPSGGDLERVKQSILRLKLLVMLQDEELLKFQAGLQEAIHQRSRETYIRECARNSGRQINRLTRKIEQNKMEVTQIQQSLVSAIREVRISERQLEHFNQCGTQDEERFGQEYDKLISLPKVQKVTVTEGRITVHTNTLFARDERTNLLHELGAYEIKIYTSGEGNGIRFHNLTRQVPCAQQAPHVDPSGRACYGNTAEIWPELIANHEYAALALLGIQFLESVNTADDWGSRINQWPQAPAEMQTDNPPTTEKRPPRRRTRVETQ
jgi:hypothetical protein